MGAWDNRWGMRDLSTAGQFAGTGPFTLALWPVLAVVAVAVLAVTLVIRKVTGPARGRRKARENEQLARQAEYKAWLNEQVAEVRLIASNGSYQEKMNLIRMYAESTYAEGRDCTYLSWMYCAMVSLTDDPDVRVVRAFLDAPMSRLDSFSRRGDSYPDWDAITKYVEAGSKFIYHPDLEIGRALLRQVGRLGWHAYHDDYEFGVDVFLTQLAECNPNQEIREEAVRLIGVRKAEKLRWEAWKRSEEAYVDPKQAAKEQRQRERDAMPTPPHYPWF